MPLAGKRKFAVALTVSVVLCLGLLGLLLWEGGGPDSAADRVVEEADDASEAVDQSAPVALESSEVEEESIESERFLKKDEAVEVSAEGENRWTLSLARGASIAGRVVDAEENEPGEILRGRVVDDDDNPIRGAQVHTYDQESQQSFSANTNAEGKFELRGLKAGTMHVSVWKENYGNANQQVAVPTEDEVVLKLSQGIRIKGRVIASDEKPLSNVRLVAAIKMGGWRGSGGARPSGEFEMTVPPGTYTIIATSDGYAPGESEEVTVAKGDAIEDLEIVVSPGAQVTGVVIDKSTGEAITNATVSRAPGSQKERYLQGIGIASASTDADGNFTLKGLPFGAVTVRASHPDYAPSAVSGIEVSEGSMAEVRIELGTGGSEVEIDPRPPVRVTGVIQSGGHPVSGLQLWVMGDG